ncbi:signal peptidase II [Serpentinicella alkaliphila]|uniref:Lipoprotein signal peptidase n=1 Tax=Serpentinicella alkaliphila TaxID=1734049 RepID=A0A4R2T5R3_9FIRM|nr:signal peptidase II [Serpentinicella alkaliphila]QUH26123.1 signal peptidase II [Serpentinicella alkaliphila]TCP98429.1 signal peptidase II [Serpentinicella alkaliphila]
MWIIIILAIVISDQITKQLVLSNLKEIGSIPIIQNVFHLTYVENRGAAFGILQNQKYFFVIMKLIVITAIIYVLIKHKDLRKSVVICLSLIVGGAIGNLIDRLRFGFVVDFFDFIIWPVFNIADMAIVLAQILLIYIVLKHDSFKQKEL